ncbi:MAG: tRNA (adenosine(37)-N6)-threonylcarbamoyltransferase complex ATPase subunit type 1 TsaE [Betaproteobacteria bacterium]|nr:tRNA (adenosine(37)-N6)-threonylcarbamoyltransferase complex ATPase subunit type 1 TsaE [Betaproteobacteria bacterium]
MRQRKDFLEDESATERLGEAIGHMLRPGLKIYLHGDLGAGKTFLTRAILRAAGHTGRVKSPTYTLLEPYTVTLQGHTVALCHFDLYRISSPREFIEAGFRDYFGDENICIVEWPEQAGDLLPKADMEIFLTAEYQGRTVELRARSELGATCLENLYPSPNT